MRSDSAFWFVFFLSIILSQIEKIIGDPQYVRKIQEKNIFGSPQSRYPEYSRQDNVFPVHFQPPTFGSFDFWKNNRRTFFEPPQKSTTLPGFHGVMTSFFEETKTPHSIKNPATANLLSLPKPFPFKLSDYNPSTNYIPSPKPIRASVIKLETITKSPNLYSFYYDTATKYSPPLGNLLNHVLIENSKFHDTQDLSFHYQPNLIDRTNSTLNIPSTALPKPNQVPLTTLKPSFTDSTFFNRKRKNDITLTQKIPVFNANEQSSVQHPSQTFNFPHFNISNFSKTLTYQLSPTGTDLKYNSPNRNISSVALKNINWIIPNPEPIPTAISSVVRISSFDTTTFKPLHKALKPINKSSLEVIANLTSEGLSGMNKSNANVQNYVNFLNINNLINYEMKNKKTSPSSPIISDEFKFHPVNFNDELSLDAKILKDTNWDNLTASESTKLVVNQSNTFQIKNKIVEKEITTEKPNETTITELFDSVKITTTFIPPTIADIFENNKIINFPSEIILESAKTNETETFPTTENLCQTSKGYDTDQETTQANPISNDTIEVTTQEPLLIPVSEEKVVETTIASIITTAENILTTFPKRNYRRRPKVVNFTPYPSPSDFQKKAINRNNFPKRQKPNITLAFGNKINVKNREEYGREVTKLSDDALGKRKRKLGKRRRLVRVKIPRVEKPTNNNTQPIL